MIAWVVAIIDANDIIKYSQSTGFQVIYSEALRVKRNAVINLVFASIFVSLILILKKNK